MGRYEPSSPSIKELHGQVICVMRQFAKTFEVGCLTNFGTAEHIPEFSDKPPRGSRLDEPVLEGAAQVLDDVPKCSNASTVQGSNC